MNGGYSHAFAGLEVQVPRKEIIMNKLMMLMVAKMSVPACLCRKIVKVLAQDEPECGSIFA